MKIAKLLILISLTACYVGDELPPDQDFWSYDLPANVSLDQDFLLQLNSRIRNKEFGEMNALIAIKDEKLVFENYYNGSGRNQMKPIGRSTIAMTNLALGIAIDEGIIGGLDDRIDTYLPEYSSIFEVQPLKRGITIRHLITYTSGLSWNESLISYLSDDSDLNIMKTESDWTAYVLGKPLEAVPGSRYGINSGIGMIISKIIQNVSQQTLEEYLNIKLGSLIEKELWEWEIDNEGTVNGADGVLTTTLEMAKIGYMMLRNGTIDRRQVVPATWIAQLMDNRTEVQPDLYDLGLSWWGFTSGSFTATRLNPNDVYFMHSESGDNLYIIPHQNIVISMEAENYFQVFSQQSLLLYIEIINSIQ